jgi:hypothetical protein
VSWLAASAGSAPPDTAPLIPLDSPIAFDTTGSEMLAATIAMTRRGATSLAAYVPW